MFFGNSMERIKNNPKILVIPLPYNLILYFYFLIGGFNLVGGFNLNFTLPGIPPNITEVVEVELPRLQELILGNLNLSNDLAFEELFQTLTLTNVMYLVVPLLILGIIISFVQAGFLGLIKDDFLGNKASFQGFINNARYFLVRLFLTKIFYFVIALLAILLVISMFLPGSSAGAPPHFAAAGGILLVLAILFIVFLVIFVLLVFHEFSIVEDDTGVIDGIRRSYITVKTNFLKVARVLLEVAFMIAVVGAVTQGIARLSLFLSIFIYIPAGTLGIYVIYSLYKDLISTIKTKIALGEEDF
ncbi:hypothetical protein [Natranaerofaba carboxydovora]|uniref:DUF7847 domain-containing protein n=1 Tax=Natranaerofaba carboxydovora TaxID=2742683 RepID=UPI001F129B47|nr:hypothetical protein [Natranaerofaba carboxydovora]